MPVSSKPNDIAREALRQLASRRQLPTPGNYVQTYCRVAGIDQMDAVPPPGAWAALLRDLVRQLDVAQQNLGPGQKKQAVVEVLSNGETEKIFPLLKDLVAGWGRISAPALLQARMAAATDATPPAPLPQDDPRELLAQTLERGVAARLASQPQLADEARALAASVRSGSELKALAAELKHLLLTVELRCGKRDFEPPALQRLLRLLIDNIQELLPEEQWLRGQLAVTRDIVEGPLSAERIEAAECSLKDAILRQGVLKNSLNEAKATLKEMVAALIARLSDLSGSTGNYHDKFDVLAGKITRTEDITQLSALLAEVMQETRGVQSDIARTRNELLEARSKAEAAERKIQEMESEIERTSEKVRVDHLTGALNRRGLDDVFLRELYSVRHHASELSIALIDIDNFKLLNDSHGHQAGDSALVHLSQVIRRTLRPTDVLARMGGEEFIILLPGTAVARAAEVVHRLQRALTKHFFLHDGKKLLITFSAGVTAIAPGEAQNEAVARADKGLYQAKRTGKNRVVAI